MLSFKKFVNKESKNYFIDINGNVVPNEPISITDHLKKKSEIKEETLTPQTTSLHTLPGQDVEGDRKEHFFKKSDEMHSAQSVPEKKQLDALQRYSMINRRTGDNASKRINRTLIDNHKEGLAHTDGMSKADQSIHNHISNLGSRPIGKESHVYSGTNIRGDEAAKESKTFYSPAHISTSHDVDVAKRFAERKGISRLGHNIMHIHLKADDRAFHAGNHSLFRGEHETIIPAGTKLNYSHTTHHHDENGKYFKVHHYTVDSQE